MPANGSGPDIINFPAASIHTLTAVNNTLCYDGPSGLPVVSSAITIEGNKSTITRAGSAPSFSILCVQPTGDLTLKDTTVSGGAVSGFYGGGVYNFGTATLTNSTVSGNSSDSGGGLYNGRPYNLPPATLTLMNSTVSGNSAIATFPFSPKGGGVFNKGTATLTNSTVSGNSASSSGGSGGGVFNFGDTATLTLTRTLISGNTASAAGGGSAEVYNNEGHSTYTASNFNLFGHSGLTNGQAFYGFYGGPSDILAVSDCTYFAGCIPTALADILAPLANNGGPTQTHALVAGSPAIDAAGPDCPPPDDDQRGVARPQGGACDIGSFEIKPLDLAVSQTDSPDPVAVSDQLTYTITGNNAGDVGATEVMLTDTLPASGITFVSANASQGSCGVSGGTVTCDLGTLASGAGATVTIVVRPTAPGTITNSVEVTSAETDENPDNNTDTEATVVNPLLCNGLTPTIVGTPGSDTLIGTKGRDVIHGLGGNDTISGGNGADVICGGEGDDNLKGDLGNDQLFGEKGNDTLDGGKGRDTCNGGSDTDTVANCETVTNIP